MSRVFDTMMFYNELDMLETRMHILNPVVDWFVVCEAAETHSGQPKPYYLQRAIDQTARFNPFLDKLIYVKVDDLTGPGRNSWEREYYQRSCIARGLVDAQPDDLIIVGDCDEIANPKTIAYLQGVEAESAKLEMTTYYYDLNHRTIEGWAIGALRWRLEKEPNYIRRLMGHADARRLWGCGWHFSYFGGAQAIVEKVDAFMHAGDPVIRDMPRDPDWVTAQVAAGKDLFNRDGFRIEYTPIDDTLPRYILDHLAHFRALGWCA